jgi:lantibiotic modifying enzyme
MSWQPLLEGAWKDRARDCIQAILDDLAPPVRDPGGEPSLAGGTTGLALLHGYLAQTERSGDHAAVAGSCLQSAIAAVADRPMEASLYSGLTGVGWALAHLRERLPGLDGEADLTEIDTVLLDHLEQSPWADDYDLISGLVGFGVYALQRLPRAAAVASLERVIDRLAESAQRQAGGICWWTNPAWLPAEARAKYPRGYCDLGLAHGVPGVIALLGQAVASGVAVARAGPLLEGAVRWLLAQQLPGGFPAWVGSEDEEKPARMAWCYGDPGVASALLGAARCLHEQGWERQALAMARRAIERPADQAGVVDAGLCHGAAGLGHLFNRLYQATGDPQLAEAARFWFDRALQMRRPERGIGGYQAWTLGDKGEMTWETKLGLLTGAAGIALSLLAATTAIEPAWDRVLLVALPPAAAG